jgi:hypothetical protein
MQSQIAGNQIASLFRAYKFHESHAVYKLCREEVEDSGQQHTRGLARNAAIIRKQAHETIREQARSYLVLNRRRLCGTGCKFVYIINKFQPAFLKNKKGPQKINASRPVTRIFPNTLLTPHFACTLPWSNPCESSLCAKLPDLSSKMFLSFSFLFYIFAIMYPCITFHFYVQSPECLKIM